MTAAEADVEQAANNLVNAASGQSFLGCTSDVNIDVETWAEASGIIKGVVRVSNAGNAVDKQRVKVSISSGSLITPSSGAGITNERGEFSIKLDPEYGQFPVVVTVTVIGQDIVIVQPLLDIHTMISHTAGQRCEFTASGVFESVELGNPRNIGFWKHQVFAALLGWEKAPVHPELLKSYLPIEAFGLEVNSLRELFNALWLGSHATSQDRAIQQYIVTQLNIHYGQFGYLTEIDIDHNGSTDGFLFEFIEQARESFASGDYKSAWSILKNINNL